MLPNNKIVISHKNSIHEAIKKIDSENLDSLIVVGDNQKVIGVFTMGDFRRAVFFGLDLNDKISLIINKNFKYLSEDFSKNKAKKIFIENNSILDIPILNKKFKLINVISRNSFLSPKELNIDKIKLGIFPVVIMAGGKGTRLDPFTRILPKPLIPFGNKPIIRVIMDYFTHLGSSKFYISVNDKSMMIKAYFFDLKSKYNISYIEENKPLGTAGSLKLIEKKLKTTFFLTNSDILINSNYLAILEFHKKNNFDLTLVSSARNYRIPYGVCHFKKNGKLSYVEEKPEYNFFINTGFYIIEPKILKLIPANKRFDMIELIDKVKKHKMNIGIYPVTENSWKDFGQWSEYNKNINLENK